MRSRLALTDTHLLVTNMYIGQKIHIIPSTELIEMGMQQLIGRSATVTEIHLSCAGTVKGCWAELEGDKFTEEQEWYFPFNSFIE